MLYRNLQPAERIHIMTASDDIRPSRIPLNELLHRGEASVQAALAEDLAGGDPTSAATLPEKQILCAIIRAKDDGVIAGLPVADRVFAEVDAAIDFFPRVLEGEPVQNGDVIAVVRGPARSVLAAERTALNFLQRMSGIATLTSVYVDHVATTDAVILDTRKTAPGLRSLDKYAVRIGGGVNHRTTLAELGMLKENHLAAAGSLEIAVQRFKNAHPTLPLEVEVRSLEDLKKAMKVAPLPERVLLDHFPPSDVRRAVRIAAERTILEASGGSELETVRAMANTGIDTISIGALTHSCPALDLSMTLDDPPEIGAAETRIKSLREKLGDRVAILAHHYVRDEVCNVADRVGDSLELAQSVANLTAPHVVLCGVRFMGETAALLARPDQRVHLPVPSAGCYLANCADLSAIENAWTTLTAPFGGEDRLVPLAYVNSSLAVKAFCGQRGGAVCTSANAARAFAWVLDQGQNVFFVPDQHLGANAALAHGIPREKILSWRPDHPPRSPQIRTARVVLWNGACNVHRRFRRWDVERIRSLDPKSRVIVHPECAMDVVQRADASGSTRQIRTYIEEAPTGAAIAVGTEARFVHRLQKEHSDKTILDLSEVPVFCHTMSQLRLSDLAECLEAIDSGRTTFSVPVDRRHAQHARRALERMLVF